jgi:hypothetical protein
VAAPDVTVSGTPAAGAAAAASAGAPVSVPGAPALGPPTLSSASAAPAGLDLRDLCDPLLRPAMLSPQDLFSGVAPAVAVAADDPMLGSLLEFLLRCSSLAAGRFQVTGDAAPEALYHVRAISSVLAALVAGNRVLQVIELC